MQTEHTSLEQQSEGQAAWRGDGETSNSPVEQSYLRTAGKVQKLSRPRSTRVRSTSIRLHLGHGNIQRGAEEAHRQRSAADSEDPTTALISQLLLGYAANEAHQKH